MRQSRAERVGLDCFASLPMAERRAIPRSSFHNSSARLLAVRPRADQANVAELRSIGDPRIREESDPTRIPLRKDPKPNDIIAKALGCEYMGI